MNNNNDDSMEQLLVKFDALEKLANEQQKIINELKLEIDKNRCENLYRKIKKIISDLYNLYEFEEKTFWNWKNNEVNHFFKECDLWRSDQLFFILKHDFSDDDVFESKLFCIHDKFNNISLDNANILHKIFERHGNYYFDKAFSDLKKFISTKIEKASSNNRYLYPHIEFLWETL